MSAGPLADTALPETETRHVLELKHISKVFGATQALDDVGLTVRRREVLALLGENGCGKSSLVKVLAGIYAPESGAEMTVDGRSVSFPLGSGDAQKLGISFVHQELGLAPSLTVLENLMPSRGTSALHINWGTERQWARQMLSSYRLDIDPLALVGRLPPVEQALVAIARAADELRTHREATGATSSLLVLDEPTVFLPEDEVEFLFDLIRAVVREGSSVIFISHDLPAVKEIADRATVLRNGRVVAHREVSELTDDDLVELIVGAPAEVVHQHRNAPAETRPVEDGRSTEPSSAGPRDVTEGSTPVRIRGLRGGPVEELDLEVAAGKILGLAGLLGSGVEEVPYLLFGAHRAEAGELCLEDRTVNLRDQKPSQALRSGLALIPADRRRDAIAPAVSVAENMMLLALDRFRESGILRRRMLFKGAAEKAEEMDVRPRRTDIPVGTLSGGNAQKVVVAKWLQTHPRLLLLHEPTQGVDVGARSQIYRVIQKAAATTGMAVVWVASDFDELATVCDRVVVMDAGRAAGELLRSRETELTQETVTSAVFRAGAHS